MTTSAPPRRWMGVLLVALAAVVHLVIAWPGAADRGVIAEEAQPYLARYPIVLDASARFQPPNDDARVRDGARSGGPVPTGWVGTNQWPEIGWQGRDRVWPVFVRGHQTGLGTWWGILTGPLLGGGIAGVRRSSVLLGLALVALTSALGRRLGLSRAATAAATLAVVLSPGLWYFTRTGYAFELASRVLLMATLVAVAPRARLDGRAAVLAGLGFALAVLCRATIAVTLVPPLALMLAHPARWASARRASIPIVLGGALPVAVAAVALLTLPFRDGTTPASHLPIDALAARTLTIPGTAWVQLAWLVDPAFLLHALVDVRVAPEPGLRALVGLPVVALAFARWWGGRATEPERLLCAGLLGNAFFGAWLYGNPLQFQLGMALEPLFALAVAAQLDALSASRARLAVGVASICLAARAVTLAGLARAEARTDNPMLSGLAQRSLAELLRARRVPEETLVTTTYDHVGVLETVASPPMRPVHAYRMLMSFEGEDRRARIDAAWDRLLDRHRVCHVLLTRSRSLVEGHFTANDLVAETLPRALERRGRRVIDRAEIHGDGGGVVFELATLSGCDEAPP